MSAVAAQLRLAEPADFPAIAAITSHYIRTTAIHFGTAPVTADELRATWQQDLDTYPWLVAAQGPVVLGYAKAGLFRTRAAYRWITETGIYLDPDQRGQGLGMQLYGRLLAVLRAQGFHSAVGVIALPNPPSVRLHEALGFRPAGVLQRSGRKFDRWHDVGFWELLLQGEDHEPGPLLPPALAFPAAT